MGFSKRKRRVPEKVWKIQRRCFTFALRFGELAHLVERLHGMQEVTGSIPVFSTYIFESRTMCGFFIITIIQKYRQKNNPLFPVGYFFNQWSRGESNSRPNKCRIRFLQVYSRHWNLRKRLEPDEPAFFPVAGFKLCAATNAKPILCWSDGRRRRTQKKARAAAQ